MTIKLDIELDEQGEKAMMAAGWRVVPRWEGDKWLFNHKTCTKESTLREAMFEVERLLGEEVTTDAYGTASVPTFWWEDGDRRMSASGWECGKYMFDKWARTPRMVLEMFNKEEK